MMRIEPITIDRVEAVFLTGVLPSMGRALTDNGAAEPAALGGQPPGAATGS
jgi:hypothetical protein